MTQSGCRARLKLAPTCACAERLVLIRGYLFCPAKAEADEGIVAMKSPAAHRESTALQHNAGGRVPSSTEKTLAERDVSRKVKKESASAWRLRRLVCNEARKTIFLHREEEKLLSNFRLVQNPKLFLNGSGRLVGF